MTTAAGSTQVAPRRSGLSKRKAALATADQALNGLSSFLLTVAVARVAPPETVAYFTLSYLAVQILLSQFRTSITQPFMVHRATVGVDTAEVERSFMAATAWLALAVTAIGGAIAVLFSGETREIMVLLAIGFPFLALTDALRYVAIARGRPGQAVAIDAVRVAGIVLPVAVWTVVGDPTALGVLGIRCGEVTVSMVFAALLLRYFPHRPRVAQWWRDHKQMAIAYGGENVLSRLSAYSVTYGLLWFATTPEVAGFRAGSTLTNLINVFFASIPMVLLPHYRTRMSAQTRAVSRGEFVRIAGTISGCVLVIAAVGSVALLALPAAVGRQLFGETWPLVRESLPGLLFWTAGTGVILGPLTVLRATARTRPGVVARTVQSVAIIVLGFAGAALGGAPGAAWGVGLGGWIGVVAWYLALWSDGEWDPRTDAMINPGGGSDSPPALVTS